MRTPLWVERVAWRSGPEHLWEWYGDPVYHASMPGIEDPAMFLIETYLQQLLEEYFAGSKKKFKNNTMLFRAETIEALNKVDLNIDRIEKNVGLDSSA